MEIQNRLMNIHGRYVYETAKLEFVARGMGAVIDKIPAELGDFSGAVLLLSDLVESLKRVNNELDTFTYEKDPGKVIS